MKKLLLALCLLTTLNTMSGLVVDDLEDSKFEVKELAKMARMAIKSTILNYLKLSTACQGLADQLNNLDTEENSAPEDSSPEEGASEGGVA